MDRILLAGNGPYAFHNIAPETMGYEDDRTGECLHLSVSTQGQKCIVHHTPVIFLIVNSSDTSLSEVSCGVSGSSVYVEAYPQV